MDKKKYTEYTKEEKIILLKHWVTCYCKSSIREKEFNIIHRIIEERTEDVLNVAILYYIINQGSTAIFNSIREEKLEQLFEISKREIIRLENEYAEDLLETQNSFLEMLVKSYNSSQLNESMSEEQLIQEILKIVAASGMDCPNNQNVILEKNSISAMEKKVIEIFNDCTFKETEMENGMPKEPYVMVEGPIENYLFSAEKINCHKEEIANLIAELPEIDYGAKYLNLCRTKSKELWTKSQDSIERLVLLGLASEILSYTLPREYWKVDDGLPRLTRNKEKLFTKVKGISPK